MSGRRDGRGPDDEPASRPRDELAGIRPIPPLSVGFVRVSAVLGVLAAVAAVAGLFFEAYRRETAFARHGFQGPDIVTIALALPALVVTTVRASRGSVRGLLLWFGVLGYLTYTYAYVVAISWNRLFPVYLTLFSMSGFALAAALVRLDVGRVAERVDPAAPVRLVSRFLWVIAVGLGVFETAAMMAGAVSGTPPQRSRSTPRIRRRRCSCSTSGSSCRSSCSQQC